MYHVPDCTVSVRVFLCAMDLIYLLGSSVTCKGVCQCVCVLFNLQVNTMISTYIRVLHLWSALRFGVSLRIDAKTKHIFGYTSSNIHSYTLILTTLVMGWLYFWCSGDDRDWWFVCGRNRAFKWCSSLRVKLLVMRIVFHLLLLLFLWTKKDLRDTLKMYIACIYFHKKSTHY